MFKFYLNNILVSNAINWIDFTETIEYDNIIKGLLPKYESKLTFTGDGYDYIHSQYLTNGFCNLIDFKVDQECSPNAGYETILNGFIFISDCTFNLNKCTVDCTVMDNNFGAKIYNNKSIKAYLNVARSKNDTAIAVCQSEMIRMFTPTTGAYSVTTRRAYKIKDAFRYLIDFMSDGDVGFESTFLSTISLNWNAEGTRLLTGAEIRLADQATAPFISFEELFKEVDIKYPLGFTIITVAGKPTIKIENEAYFKKTTPSLTISNIQDLKQSFDSELLYSKIKFGGEFIDYDGVLYSFKQTRFFNFANEEYHTQGLCNIDKTLDLTAEFISDSNIIEGVFATDTLNESYDENIFFVQIDSTTLDAIINVDPITLVDPYYYNDKLQNNKVAERFNLQGNIALYLGNNDDTFRAQNTGLQDISADYAIPFDTTANIISQKIAFQNDSLGLNFDTNNNYNNLLFKFTSPASGSYNLESTINIIINGAGTLGSVLAQVVFNVYTAGGVLERTEFCPQYNFTPVFIPAPTYAVFGAKNIYVPAGFYVECCLSLISYSFTGGVLVTTVNSLVVITNSYFTCTQSVNGGGVYQVEDPADYFISKFEFESQLSKTNYDLIKSDLAKAIIINHDGSTNKKTWIRKTVRTMATGAMKFEQISSKNNSQ